MERSNLDRLRTFRRLYETNISALVRFAQRFTSVDTAEDIVQDIFLELWKSGKTLDETTARSYLFASVHNRCINLLKHEQVKELYIQNTMLDARLRGLDHSVPVEQLLIEKELLQQIYKQIELLPDKCRQVFKLAYFDEKKSPEIANLLQLSIRTVEHQLYLGLKILRNELFK